MLNGTRLVCSDYAGYIAIVLAAFTMIFIAPARADEAFDEPVFDIPWIETAPLEAETTNRAVKDGIVIEHVSFVGDRELDGSPIRIVGILAYPEGGKNLPAVMWGQGGMAPAGAYFPELFAKKGYASLSITLPLDHWNAWGPFNVEDPANANMVHYAACHMRGITYLANRAEVNVDKIGMGGSSYGGVYATLVTGADRRVKAGMTYFSAGNHHLGSSLPQVTGMKDAAAMDVFKRTGDGAWRIAKRDVPMMYGVAANDHWFHLPALVETYRNGSQRSRIGVLPHWAHGFPPEYDQQLADWFDVHLMGTRKPYNQPSEATFKVVDGKLVATWTWAGDNAVKSAQLLVSYGDQKPWHGWINRFHWPVDGTVTGDTATAEIVVPDPDLPIYVIANVRDEHDVVTSSLPVLVTPRSLGVTQATGGPAFNCFPWGDFEAADVTHLQGVAMMSGKADRSEQLTGKQSVRVDGGNDPQSKKPDTDFKLLNVYDKGHRLRIALKASEPTRVAVAVLGERPRSWDRPGIAAILKRDYGIDAAAELEKPLPVYQQIVDVGTEWKHYEIECPDTDTPVEGYRLMTRQVKDGTATYWLDDVSFTPMWNRGE